MLDLKKEVTRREFLRSAGVLMAFGFLAKPLFGLLSEKKESSNSYGNDSYGGKQ